MKSNRKFFLVTSALYGGVLGMSMLLAYQYPLSGCSSPQSAQNAIFTAEQTVCMAATVLGEDLTGQPEVIASDLTTVCKIAPTFTQEVMNFVQSWLATPNGQAMKMKKLKAPVVP